MSAGAAVVSKIDREALEPLRRPGASKRIRLQAVPLYDSQRSVIDLEEFQVWAPGAKIVIHGPNGVERIDPPAMRFYRGQVNEDKESFAFFAVSAKSGMVQGLVVTRDDRFAVLSQLRPKVAGRLRDGGFDDFLTRVDESDRLPGEQVSWQCDVDKMKSAVPEEMVEANAVVAAPVEPAGLTGSQEYEITLQIETDFELYSNAGSNVTTLTNYVTNLVGALSTIYNRDLNTNVLLADINTYTISALADPWSAASSSAGLYELGDFYHNNVLNGSAPSNRVTTAVALLSGKNVSGGIAWEGIICGNDFFQDTNPDPAINDSHWGGPYSWNGCIGQCFAHPAGIGTIPDPDATNSAGTPYGMPSGFQNYWPLTQLSHELGHNFAGHHTHCAAISDAERAASGFSDGSPNTSASNQVDHCYGAEGRSGCFSGSTYTAGSQTIFKGTIMSYCHNVFVSSIPQSRFVFALGGEPSMHQLDDYMMRAAGPIQVAGGSGLDGGPRNIVSGVGAFTMTLTAPDSVIANSTGNVASITANPSAGATYSWTITNGTITSGQGTNSITFTAGASESVILKAISYNTQRCGISETKSIAITAAFEPPTGVVATAATSTSVDVTWNAVDDATEYRVYRASTQGSFGDLVGTTSNTTFTDNTAAANTSYQYVVTAGDGTNFSEFSDDDWATTVIFTDPAPGTTTIIKLAHFTELLTAVNALRTLTGAGAIAFTSPSPATGITVREAHVEDLRTGLDAPVAALTGGSPSFGETISAGSAVKASHVIELRNFVK